MKKTVSIIMIITPFCLMADEFNFKSFDGVRRKGKTTSSKGVEASYLKHLKGLFGVEFNAGTLIGDNTLSGNIPSLYGEVAACSTVRIGSVYGRLSQGVSLHTKTVSGINSFYQLPTTLQVGLENKKHSMGLFYKHFSNGSTQSANRGIDYLGFSLGWKL